MMSEEDWTKWVERWQTALSGDPRGAALYDMVDILVKSGIIDDNPFIKDQIIATLMKATVAHESNARYKAFNAQYKGNIG